MSSASDFLNDSMTRHFEELEFLLAQRAAALASPERSLEHMYELEERIDAHLDGLILGAQHAVPLLQEAIEGEEPGPVEAAAYALLWMRSPETARLVIKALAGAEPPKAAAICHALCHAPIDLTAEDLQSLLDGSPVSATAAAATLAYHGQLKADPQRLAELSTADDPGIRAATWRLAALL
jgi:hypothetical protein